MASRTGRFVLTLSDDGRGIDDDAIYAQALKKGLIEGERAKHSSDSLHRLLFTPGFSTTEKVTTFSGRGVGLDVVEATAIRLNGDVTVRSSPGHGVTFRVSVPLHCARLAVVPLRVGKEWIAVNASEITSIERTSDLTGLLSAASLFPGPEPKQSLKPPFLRVECLTGSRWAFDEVGQPEDVMVREASAFAKGSHGVIGGARMRDGRSVLLIDLNLLSTIAASVGQN
ncbi:MAG: hypothetical protein HY074_03300 [Deltaproteobacteria bacterium]|nr:hypothetical protein [Deltaproteobacteria bacterium]